MKLLANDYSRLSGEKNVNVPIRCNNPGNLRPSRKKWKGSIADRDKRTKGFVEFVSVGWGIRALIIDMRTKIKTKRNSIAIIIPIYAPQSDGNNTILYIQKLLAYYNRFTKGPKITEHTAISFSKDNARLLVQGISIVEGFVSREGRAGISDAEFELGWSLLNESPDEEDDVTPEVKIKDVNQVQPESIQKPIEGFFEYYHTDSNITNITDLLNFKKWINPATKKQFTPIELLDLKNTNNRDNVRGSYSKNKKIDIKEGKEATYIAPGTTLLIPNSSLSGVVSVFTEGNRVTTPEDVRTFIPQQLKSILQDIGYKQTFKSSKFQAFQKRVPQVSVCMWCKGLGKFEEDSQQLGGLIDISPFVINCQTTVGEQGSFSLTLAPIPGEFSDDEGWTVKRNILQYYRHKETANFVAEDSSHRMVGEELLRNNFLFHNLINSNDIVFIRFERLDMEKDRNQINGDTLTVPYSDLASSELAPKVYDMIGLVDKNSISYNPQRTDVSISVSGRDLSKLLIEDTLQFFNLPPDSENKKEFGGIFKNENPENWGRLRRRYERDVDNPLDIFHNIKAPSIKLILEIIFSKLASVEICPDNVFESYQNDNGTLDRVSSYQYWDESQKKIVRFRAAGIWQIIKLLFDNSIKDRVIFDSSIAITEGSLMSAIQKYTQQPFVEMWGDTYGDQFYFTVRKPVTDREGVEQMLKFIDSCPALEIDDKDVLSENLSWYDGEVPSYYRIQPAKDGGSYVSKVTAHTMPVVYFREYAEIWGNKGREIQSNFLPEGTIDPTIPRGDPSEQLFKDLKYVIESTAYLPFTRQGTITINGDRRIKKGMWIRYRPTRELFLIDSVTQSWGISGKIDRTTTLQVSRGIKEDTDNGESIYSQYFDVINFGDKDDKGNPIKVQKTTKVVGSLKETNIYFDANIIAPIGSSYGDHLKTLDPTYDEIDINKRMYLYEDTSLEIYNIVQELNANKSTDIEIVCFMDTYPTIYIGGNQGLSLERAKNIRNIIIERYIKLHSDKSIKSRITATYAKQSIDNKRSHIEYRTITKQTEDQSKTTVPTNWKVNQSVFYRFLRRRQFAPQLQGAIRDDLQTVLKKPTSNIDASENIPPSALV